MKTLWWICSSYIAGAKPVIDLDTSSVVCLLREGYLETIFDFCVGGLQIGSHSQAEKLFRWKEIFGFFFFFLVIIELWLVKASKRLLSSCSMHQSKLEAFLGKLASHLDRPVVSFANLSRMLNVGNAVKLSRTHIVCLKVNIMLC